jgi:hypothetical protein
LAIIFVTPSKVTSFADSYSGDDSKQKEVPMAATDPQELYEFAETYNNYPDLASNIALDAEEMGEPDKVINFFESLGDTYIEDKDQAVSMIEQVDEQPTDDLL